MLPLVVGLILFALGAYVSLFNFYAGVLRYPIHRLRGGTRENFPNVSFIPIIGILLLLFAAAALKDHRALMWTALTIAALDTSGPHWLITALILHLVRKRDRA
jgi:hypothetical protein